MFCCAAGRCGRFPAVSCGFLRAPLREGFRPPAPPPCCASGVRRRRLLGGPGGAVAPPAGSAPGSAGFRRFLSLRGPPRCFASAAAPVQGSPTTQPAPDV
eukprot:4613617-Alexandrium_andersonii.AAC.1